MRLVSQLCGESNVATPAMPLDPNSRYVWRVDGQMSDGSVVRGVVWSFETGGKLACPAGVR